MFVVLPNPDPVTVTLPGAGYLGESMRFVVKSVQLNVSGPTIVDGSGEAEAWMPVRTVAETNADNKDIFIF